MNFFKSAIYTLLLTIFLAFNANADNHDKEQNIVERAKEVNQKIKEQQANQKSNISSEISKEEPLPLNDPFVGDGTLGGSSSGVKLIAETEEKKKKLSVFNYKLVGVIEGEGVGFASLVTLSFKLKKMPKPKQRDIIINCSKGKTKIKSVKN